MTLRESAPLQSALERRGAALRDVDARAIRVADQTQAFAEHLDADAAARTQRFVEAVVPKGAPTRTTAARKLGLPSRDVLGGKLRERILIAKSQARIHNCALSEVDATIEATERELESIQTHGRELARSCDRLGHDPLFVKLCREGYDDTERFPFWKFSSHRHRKEAAVVLARFGPSRGVDTFSNLRAQHADHKRSLTTLEGEMGQLHRRLDQLREIAPIATLAMAFEREPGEAMTRAWRDQVIEQLDAKRPQEILQALKKKDDDESRDGLSAPNPLLVLAREALGARARSHYLHLATAHFVDRTRQSLASRLHDVDATVDVLQHGQKPHVVWPDIERVDADTDEIWQEASDELDRFERIRDALVSFQALDSLVDDRPYWDQIIDFDPGDFIDALVMERALAPAATATNAVNTWDRAATAAAERLAMALASSQADSAADADEGTNDDAGAEPPESFDA